MKRIQCPICKGQFGQGHAYRSHMRKHARETMALLRLLSDGQGYASLAVIYDSQSKDGGSYFISITHERDGGGFKRNDVSASEADRLIAALVRQPPKDGYHVREKV